MKIAMDSDNQRRVSDMKIEQIETISVDAKSRNWVFVKIITDEGIVGFGDASIEGREDTVATAVSEMARYLTGKNPFQIERHYQYIYRGQFWRGGPILMSALSGIEQALWDIVGKHLNQPVYNLMGGSVRDKVCLYANGWMDNCNSIDDVVKRAQWVVSKGFKAMKLPGFDPNTLLSGESNHRWGVDCTHAVREAVGPNVYLMVDMHARMTPADAIAIAREYKKLNIYFFEEPVPPENVTSLLEVKQQSGLRIATGERLFTRFGFREVLERSAADIIQPDLCHCGGIMEAKKIAAMAEVYNVLVSPHNPNSPLSTAASVQFAICTHNFGMLEYMVEDVPWREELFPDAFRIEDGFIIPSDKPGLGIELNEEVAHAHPAKPVDLPVSHLPDGTVAEY